MTARPLPSPDVGTVPVLHRRGGRGGPRGRRRPRGDVRRARPRPDPARGRGRAALGVRPARDHRAGRVRRRRPAGRARSPRSSASSPPATPASRRSRTATSSTSTRCATRAPPSSRVLLRRGAGRQAVRQRAVRGRHQARARHPHDADPRRPTARWTPRRHQGLQHRRALRHWIPVLAHQDTSPRRAPARCTSPGSSATRPASRVTDDWDGMGQRTTASGTVELDDVEVDRRRITPYHLTFEGPQTYGAFAQVLHAAIDAGIARAALDEAAEFVRTTSRPYPDAGVERAADDPLVVHAFGEMELAVRAAEALLREAGPGRRRGRRRPRPRTAPAPPAWPSPPCRAPLGRRGRRRVQPALRGAPAPARRSTRSTSTGTGATRAPTPCTTRPPGRSSTSAATPSTAPCRPTTDSSDVASLAPTSATLDHASGTKGLT